MVTVLQLNRLELKEMITQEIVKNPVLEEATEAPGEEITPRNCSPAGAESVVDPADRQILEAAVLNDANSLTGSVGDVAINGNLFPDADEMPHPWRSPDPWRGRWAGGDAGRHRPFDEIDFGSFFDDYLTPAIRARFRIGREALV